MKRFVVSIVIFATALISIAYGRTWTDQKGRHITADYVSFLPLKEPKVKLMKPNGEYILVPVKALSKEDQEYIQGLNGNNPVKVSTENNNPVLPESNIPQGASNKQVTQSVVYSSIKNMDIGSREAYQALIQIRDSDPSKLEPDYTIALLYIFKQKDYLHAQQHLTRCLKISPDNAGVLLNMGTLCILQGKYPEAVGYYQKVYAMGEANQTLNHNLQKLIAESNSHNIFLPAAVRNKIIDLSSKVSQNVKTKYNPKQGWMFEKCSDGVSAESHKCHWFQLKGYRPYEFPVCPKCNGTGKVDCPNKNCSGGKVPIMVNKTTRIPNGRSVTMQVREHKTCNVCKGKNHVPCPHCKGSGLEFQLSQREIAESERRIQDEIVERKLQAQRAIEEKERQAKIAQAEKERQAQKEREEQIQKEREERRLKAIKARTIVVGDCEISITDISNGYVPLRNETSSGSGVSYGTQNVQQRIMSGISYSSKPQLMLKVRIKNNNPKKIIHFNTWAGDSPGPKASLSDNVNTYRRYIPDYGKNIYGNSTQESIYPGYSRTETLAFEPPAPGTTKLTLVLPGENIGEEGSFKIEFNYRF